FFFSSRRRHTRSDRDWSSACALPILLVATAAAFALTERLKLVKSPIYGTVISPVFSPTCRCELSTATVSLKFRRRDSVTVTVMRSEERRVGKECGTGRARAR